MSKTIDEKVVSMQFDNSNFEKNVSSTMGTLDKLKQSLNFSGASKGLDSISSAASGVNMSSLGNAVETVQAKFSALQVMAITALSNITNSAVNAAKNLVTTFAIQPITTGFNEYELKMGSIQTIMAGTGESLETVNKYLDELNTYSDKTIYSFSDMTSNIGKFTNAGVKLEDAVLAIKGISNEAAVSGANANEASRAMYNFSQALSAGYVKLIDWKSVENANMATVEFKQQLIDTAVEVGTLTKTTDGYVTSTGTVITATSNFNDSLQDQWMTTDVLVNTLSDYADETTEIGKKAYASAQDVKTFSMMMDTLKEAAQSGWAQTWEIVVGDFEEAKTLWTELSEMFGNMLGDSATSRNNLLEGALGDNKLDLSDWKQIENAGDATSEFQEQLLDAAVAAGTLTKSEDGVYKSLNGVTAGIKNANGEFDIYNTGLREQWLTTNTVISALRTKTGLVDADIQSLRKVGKESGYASNEFKELATNLGITDEATQTTTANLLKMCDGIDDATGRSLLIDSLRNAIEALVSVFSVVKDAWREIFPATTSEQLYGLIEIIHSFSEKLKMSEETAAKVKTTLSGFFAIIGIGVTFIKELAGGVISLLGNFSGLGDGILDITSAIGEWLIGLRNSVNETNVFGTAIHKIISFLDPVLSKLREMFGWLKEKIMMPGLEGFLDILSSIWSILGKVASKVWSVVSTISSALVEAFRNGDIENGLNLLNTGIFTGILLGVKKFVGSLKDSIGGAKGFFGSITDVLDGVKDSLTTWQRDIQAGPLKKIAVAIAILAAALLVLSFIKPEKLGTALAAITGLFVELALTMKALDKLGGKGKMMKLATMMIALSAAILILSFALKNLSGLTWEELGKGLTGVLGLMVILVAAMTFLSKNAKTVRKGAIQMVIIGAAMEIFADVAKKFGAMEWEELGKAGAAIAGILILTAIFMLLSSSAKHVKKSAVALVIIGAAMEIFADVVDKFGAVEWTELAKAGAAIGGILILASGFMLLSGMAKKMTKSAVALVIIGAAMEIFADVVDKFGKMEWKELGKAGAAIAGILILASGFGLLSGLASKITRSVVALIILAMAMEIFADIANKFGSMDWEELAKAGVAIAGILVLASGFALLSGLSSGMVLSAAALLIMAGALAILAPVLRTLGAMSWGEIAKGLVAIAGAFAILGVAGLVLGPLVPVILALSIAFALLGVGCVAIGAGIVLVAVGIGTLAAALGGGAAAIVAGITSIVTAFIELGPAIIAAIGEAIVLLCGVIIESASVIGEAIVALLAALINTLVESLPIILDGVYQLIIGVLTGLVEYIPQIADLLFQFLISIITFITEKIPELVDVIVPLIITLINAVTERVSEIVTAVAGLFQAIFQGIADVIGPLVETVIGPLIESLGSVIVGIVEAISPYIPEICEMITTVVQVVSDAIVAITQALAPFIPNINEIVASVTEAIVAICDAFISLVEQIAPVIDSITDLIQQLGDSITQILTGVSEVITTCGDTITEILTGISETIDTVFTGISDVITSIGDSIANVLDSIAEIFESIGDAALNAGLGFEHLANGVETIVDLNLIDVAASMTAVAAGLAEIAACSSGLSDAGEGMKRIVDGTTLSADAFDTMAQGIETVKTGLSSIGSTTAESMSALTRGVISGAAAVKVAFIPAIQGMITVIQAKQTTFATLGKLLMTRFGMGIKSSSRSIISSLTSLVSSAVSGIRIYYSSFYTAGQYLGQGLIEGINSKWTAVYRSAFSLGQAAVQGEMAGQQSQSPSKAMIKAGHYFGEGLIIGIKQMTASVYKSSKSIGEEAVGGLTNAIAKVSDLIDSGMETQPTIRPVLDLSDVESGVGAIDGLLNANPSIGATAHIRAIGSMMSENQNGVNDDVISAIENLGRKVGAAVGNTYNVNGVTYDDGSNISDAVKTLIRAARIERRA